jgi:hypothetical protein
MWCICFATIDPAKTVLDWPFGAANFYVIAIWRGQNIDKALRHAAPLDFPSLFTFTALPATTLTADRLPKSLSAEELPNGCAYKDSRELASNLCSACIAQVGGSASPSAGARYQARPFGVYRNRGSEPQGTHIQR